MPQPAIMAKLIMTLMMLLSHGLYLMMVILKVILRIYGSGLKILMILITGMMVVIGLVQLMDSTVILMRFLISGLKLMVIMTLVMSGMIMMVTVRLTQVSLPMIQKILVPIVMDLGMKFLLWVMQVIIILIWI